MSADVDSLLKEMDSILVDLRESLRAMNNFNVDDRHVKIVRCQKLIESVKTTKEAIVLEARMLPSAQDKLEVQQSLNRRLELFKSLQQVFFEKRDEIDRDQLQAEADSEDFHGEEGGAQGLIARGDQLQDETEAAIQNMQGLALGAEQVGLATAAKMDAQIAQMKGVGQNLDDVQYNTKRAKATALQMARGAAKDLCIQILCGGIVLCTITLIVLINV